MAATNKPERVVFVLLENEPKCEAPTKSAAKEQQQTEDACSIAPKVNAPSFNSPCYNGGTCISSNNNNNTNVARQQIASLNYSCVCPIGFTGPLCEINIDDCVEHQCQNGAMCIDDINSYKCVCRDPTTSGEFCEQLNQSNSYQTNSANSIAPIALPIVSLSSNVQQPTAVVNPFQAANQNTNNYENFNNYNNQQSTLTARSADFYQTIKNNNHQQTSSECKRSTQRKYYYDGNGCQSVRMLKISDCSGACNAGEGQSSSSGCCLPAKIKRRRIRMQCNDGASYVKTIDLVKKCACSTECSKTSNNNNNKLFDLNQQQNTLFNATQEDQILQITKLDAID